MKINKTSLILATILSATANAEGYYICIPCEKGEYENNGKCTPCPAGSYSNLNGQSQCTPCPAGTYQPNKGQTNCITCPAGSYTPNATSCQSCPNDHFCPGNGSANRCTTITQIWGGCQTRNVIQGNYRWHPVNYCRSGNLLYDWQQEGGGRVIGGPGKNYDGVCHGGCGGFPCGNDWYMYTAVVQTESGVTFIHDNQEMGSTLTLCSGTHDEWFTSCDKITGKISIWFEQH